MATETPVDEDVQRGPFERWVRRVIKNPERAYRAMFYTAMVVFLLTTLFPFYWLLVLALTPFNRLSNVGLVPNGFNPEAFIRIFELLPFHIYMLNSFILAAVTTAFVLVIASLAGYVFGRLEFPGRRPLMLLVLAISYFPPAAFLLPLFRVIMPLSAPGVATAGVLTFIMVYNEFFFSFLMNDGQIPEMIYRNGKLLYLSDQNHWAPLLKGILGYQGQYKQLYNLMAASSIVGVLPVAFIVVVAQEKIVSGLTQGALKE